MLVRWHRPEQDAEPAGAFSLAQGIAEWCEACAPRAPQGVVTVRETDAATPSAPAVERESGNVAVMVCAVKRCGDRNPSPSRPSLGQAGRDLRPAWAAARAWARSSAAQAVGPSAATCCGEDCSLRYRLRAHRVANKTVDGAFSAPSTRDQELGLHVRLELMRN
jgi:hypothetical protein